MRQGSQRADLRGRRDSGHAVRSRPLDERSTATMFTGWIYDHLVPHAPVKVAHPLVLRAIAAAKKKNDRIDAGKLADCLRCDFLPECKDRRELTTAGCSGRLTWIVLNRGAAVRISGCACVSSPCQQSFASLHAGVRVGSMLARFTGLNRRYSSEKSWDAKESRAFFSWVL